MRFGPYEHFPSASRFLRGFPSLNSLAWGGWDYFEMKTLAEIIAELAAAEGVLPEFSHDDLKAALNEALKDCNPWQKASSKADARNALRAYPSAKAQRHESN